MDAGAFGCSVWRRLSAGSVLQPDNSKKIIAGAKVFIDSLIFYIIYTAQQLNIAMSLSKDNAANLSPST